MSRLTPRQGREIFGEVLRRIMENQAQCGVMWGDVEEVMEIWECRMYGVGTMYTIVRTAVCKGVHFCHDTAVYSSALIPIWIRVVLVGQWTAYSIRWTLVLLICYQAIIPIDWNIVEYIHRNISCNILHRLQRLALLS